MASVAALQLGSLAVTAEAWVSGTLTSHPAMFAGLMQGIHLAIGLAEGVFTAAVVVLANRTNLFANISGLILLAVLMFGVCSVIMFKNGEYGKQ